MPALPSFFSPDPSVSALRPRLCPPRPVNVLIPFECMCASVCLVSPLVPAASRPSLDTRCASPVFLFQVCTQSADDPADPRILSRTLPVLRLSFFPFPAARSAICLYPAWLLNSSYMFSLYLFFQRFFFFLFLSFFSFLFFSFLFFFFQRPSFRAQQTTSGVGRRTNQLCVMNTTTLCVPKAMNL